MDIQTDTPHPTVAGKRPRKNRMSAEEITDRYFGGEPRWGKPADEKAANSKLMELLNWYSYHKERKDAKAFILAYLKKIGTEKEYLAQVEVLSESEFPTTMGWVARILTLGAEKFPEKAQGHIDRYLAELKIVVANNKAEIENAEKKPARMDIQRYLEEQLRGYLGTIAGEVDSFIENGFKSNFSLSAWLSDASIKAIQTKRIAESLEKDVQEFRDAVNKVDEQLVEGYSHWTTKQLKALIEFHEKMLEDAWTWHGAAKRLGILHRKPRARKSKSPEQQTAKVKYQRRDDESNLTSVEPKKLIGATQAWVYNTKYRMLGVYNAANDRGFFVKGTTLQNFDEKASIEKKLRKPEKILPKVNESGKVALRKVMDLVRCKERCLTGRLNENTIIIKVF